MGHDPHHSDDDHEAFLKLNPRRRTDYARDLVRRTLDNTDSDPDTERVAKMVAQALPDTYAYTETVEVSISNLTNDRHAAGTVERTDAYVVIEDSPHAVLVDELPINVTVVDRPDTGGDSL